MTANTGTGMTGTGTSTGTTVEPNGKFKFMLESCNVTVMLNNILSALLKVYRLYTEESYNNLPMATVPEVQRCDTSPIVLQLKALGIDNIVRFSFLSAPPAANLVKGVELLFALGALDQNAHLTRPLGNSVQC